MKNYLKTKTELKYGANFNRETKTVDFKLASGTAENVLLCIFKNPLGDIPFMTVEMEKDNDVFKVSIPENEIFKKQDVIYYGYRVFGENFKKTREYKTGSDIGFISVTSQNGGRFNPNKLAYDPYSIEITHVHSDVSSDLAPFRSGERNYLSDNSKIAPKTAFGKIKEQKIRKTKIRALKDEIIAEVHLKDLTRLVKTSKKGTYKAAAGFVKKIKETGVTMVEFLPLNEFDSNLEQKNHWGYMPLNYFALKKSYSADKSPFGALYEFRKLIDEFHKNDIKVCMDVVYNHTGEGGTIGNNENANLFSYALIDNKNYYKLAQNAHYTNHSGCGNDLNTLNPISSDLIIESLNFWINQGVDAFRFDLAVCMMDTSASGYAMYDKNGGMLSYLKKKLEDKGHRILSPNEKGDGVYLIAEPWMCSGAYSYQLGNFPSYFAEWNDVARDTIRAISIRPNNVNPQAMRNLIEGSPQKFKEALRSINYVSCHDGFCLYDLNTFDKPSPDTRGGFSSEMCSSYNGDVKEQNNAILKQVLLTMISSGIPMIAFGDIFLHSKQGNNNSYNLDNEINRINYKLDSRKQKLNKFILELIKLRKTTPLLSESFYPSRIEYFYPSGIPLNDFDDSYWKNNCSNIICFKINDTKNNLYVAISKDKNPIRLFLPKNKKGSNWYLTVDTKKEFINLKGKKEKLSFYELEPYSACVFKEKKEIFKWN